MDIEKVIISFGKRSIFHRILAAVCFSTAIILVYKYFFEGQNFIRLNKYVDLRNGILPIAILFIFGFRFSINACFQFKLNEMKYRKYYFIGPIGYGTWKKFKKLDRVSTFLNGRNECEVNIWDIKNNRYKIAVFGEVNDAVLYGRDLAETLNIKFKERK